jgi:hypothetical protein
MSSRRPFPLAVAAVIVAAGLLSAAPAAASVTYDPDTRTGFVDRADVQHAFGWTDATMSAKAGGIDFDHQFWADDLYSVTCGDRVFPVVHHRDYGRYELTDTVTRAGRGYHGKLLGFRLTGAHSGISGTSVAPAAGQPCPGGQGQGTIDAVRPVSTTTGWALTVTSGTLSHQLLTRETPITA